MVSYIKGETQPEAIWKQDPMEDWGMEPSSSVGNDINLLSFIPVISNNKNIVILEASLNNFHPETNIWT